DAPRPPAGAGAPAAQPAGPGLAVADKAYRIALDGEAVDEDFYADVLSLNVEESTATAGACRLRLAITRDEQGVWSYLEDDRLALFKRLSVKVGFMSGGGLARALGGLLGAGGHHGPRPGLDRCGPPPAPRPGSRP